MILAALEKHRFLELSVGLLVMSVKINKTSRYHAISRYHHHDQFYLNVNKLTFLQLLSNKFSGISKYNA